MKYQIDDYDFTKIVENSTSIRQVLIACNLKPSGGNYKTTKNRISKLNLDTSHFLGKRASKGMVFPNRTTPSSFFLNNSLPITSYKLKLKLLKEGIKSHICENCSLSEWLEKPIPLELHHIDGKPNNNNLNNLQLLCPNCHAMTDNYRGKNVKS